MPKHALKHAIESGALINPGTRELVLYMAEHKQEPSIPKAKKNGWEAVDRYFWGYIDTARFTKAAVPDADSWVAAGVAVVGAARSGAEAAAARRANARMERCRRRSSDEEDAARHDEAGGDS